MKKKRYQKISELDTGKATPDKLLRDLKIRAKHYSKLASSIAQRNIRIHKTLNISSFLLSAVALAILWFYQADKFSKDIVVWSIGILNLIIAIISIFLRIRFDSKVSAKILYVSQQFFEIKEDVKILEALRGLNKLNDKSVMIEYEKLMNQYTEKREKFIEYVEIHGSYYTGPRKIGEIRNTDEISFEFDDIE